MPQDRQKIESFRVESPIGTIESDSGNHLIDVISVVGVIAVIYIGKKIISKYFNWSN